MAGRWHIDPHPRREWIIRSGDQRLAVTPQLGQALQVFQGARPSTRDIQRQLKASGWSSRQAWATARGLNGGFAWKHQESPRGRRPSVWLRQTILPAAVVQRLARVFESWAQWRFLLGWAVLGMGLYACSFSAGVRVPELSPVQWVYGGLMFFALAIFHEIGHAAALQREGYRPGSIGVGLLFVIPVLFADVSAVSALSRRGMLRVDLAGVCFQLGAGSLIFTAGAMNPSWNGSGPLLLAGGLAWVAVIWSLVPFIRADGYWFLCDFLRLQDLDRPAPSHRGWRLRLFLVLHRLFNGAFLVLVGTLFPLRLLRLIQGLLSPLNISPYGPALLVAGMALFLWWGLIQRLGLLYSACRHDLRKIVSP